MIDSYSLAVDHIFSLVYRLQRRCPTCMVLSRSSTEMFVRSLFLSPEEEIGNLPDLALLRELERGR